MTLKFNLKADKFPAAQWVEHQTAPCCGRGQGSIPDAGKLVIFVFIYFIFLSISFSLLITSIFFVAVDTHIIYHQIDYMSVLVIFSSSFALVVIFVLFFIFFIISFILLITSLWSLYMLIHRSEIIKFVTGFCCRRMSNWGGAPEPKLPL